VSAVDRVLDKLDRVKPTAPGRWASACPCCQSRRGRPISLRETTEGIVLLHVFCGCQKADVLAALGLTLADLFDRPVNHHIAPSRSRIPARDLLELVSFEVDAAAIILAAVIEGKSCSELAWQRLAQAAARIGRAKVHCHER
jgi:hypothetical protein